jgi:glycosyltransferase involved in cell wall biosynthesis
LKDCSFVVISPKVSVCIPTFNGAAYVRGAVDSILQQEYQDFEVVIVDNCSADQTEALVVEISAQSGKIRFFRNEQNIGLAGNLNKCLEHARGEYIKYLCVDDLLLPGCLEQMVVELDTHPAVSLVCGGRLSMNESGQPFGLRRYSSHKEVVPGYKVITRCLFGGNFIGEPTAVMFRKSDMLARFRDDLPQLMDMEMWFRLLESGELLNIEIPLCAIRFHEAQMTQANIKSGRLIEDNVRIFNEFSKKPYLKVTPWLVIRHKLLMTYRVWVSRKFISSETRRSVLTRFGIRFVYSLMPMISSVLALKRKFGRRAR